MGARTSTLARERSIIESLKQMPKTMYGLSDELGIQYYTVRRIISDLVERKVVEVDSVVDRHTVYRYNGNETMQDHIPRVVDIINKNSHKVTSMLEATGKEHKIMSTKAAMRLIHHVSNLMRLAVQADHGQNINTDLDKIKERMSRDMLILQNSVKVYQQIIQDPRFWEHNTLAKMVSDPDFNTQQILEAWEYFRDHEDLRY